MLVWLLIKHFICDYPLQAFPWMYKNKGTYGHLGGIVHALIHALGTFLVVICMTGSFGLSISAATIDGFVHYHIDWSKMNIGKHFDWRPDNSEKFWILLGLDQLLHNLTYAFIAYVLI